VRHRPLLQLSFLPFLIMSIFNASRLLGKTALITGASAGIGAVRPPALSTIKSRTNPLTTSHAASRLALFARPPPYCLQRYRSTSQCLARLFTFHTGRLKPDSPCAPKRSARESRRGREGRAQGVWSAGGWYNRDYTARCLGQGPGSCVVVQGTARSPQCRHPRYVLYSAPLMGAES